MKAEYGFSPMHIAPCGMNCGICSAYLRAKNKCPGCRGADEGKPVTRLSCRIKTCGFFVSGKTEYCFACDEYPCANLAHLDKRYRNKYHMSMIDNLEDIKKSGMRKFLKSQKLRWTCKNCGGTINVHRGVCADCGKESVICSNR